MCVSVFRFNVFRCSAFFVRFGVPVFLVAGHRSSFRKRSFRVSLALVPRSQRLFLVPSSSFLGRLFLVPSIGSPGSILCGIGVCSAFRRRSSGSAFFVPSLGRSSFLQQRVRCSVDACSSFRRCRSSVSRCSSFRRCSSSFRRHRSVLVPSAAGVPRSVGICPRSCIFVIVRSGVPR